MFEKFRKLDKGRIKIKLMAVILVISLTFSNFAILGSIMEKAISSYAEGIELNEQTNETNNSNVKFDAYLMKNSNGEKVREQTADINSQDAVLHLEISVQGEGYLDNARIELGDTNFDNEKIANTQNLIIGTIEAGENVNLEIPLIANKDANYNLALLNMVSQIKLAGEYVSTNGQVSNIESVKYIKVDWTTDSITADDIELSQSVITNKIYNINGANKRIIQMLVTAKIKENKAPVKSSVIEIKNPEIGLVPETVKVASYSTKATNGKTDLEFNDGVTSAWEYKFDEGKTYIETSNAANENIVSWEKECADEYIVTYVYSYNENDTIVPFVCDAKATIELYGRTTDVATVEKTNELSLETIDELGDIVNLETNITEKIYKGELYVNGETTYEIKNSLYIPYSDVIKTVATMEEDLDQLKDAEGNYIDEEDGAEIYYKSIKVNAAQARKLLGTTGTIKIYNIYSDEMPKIGEIVLSEETEEEYYEISFENLEKEVNMVGILTSATQTEGILDIIIEKTIKVSEPEIIPNITKLTVNQAMSAINVVAEPTDEVDESDIIAIQSNENVANFLEPVTTFDISLDKNTLSTQVENELEITTELKSNDSSNKLFSNPTIKIELPKEFGEISIENIEPTLHSGELTLKTQLDSSENLIVTKEDGTRELVIELDGTQTKYNEVLQNVTVGVVLKVGANPFIADKNVEIKATCINGEDNVESKENIKLISKSGLITKNTLTVGTNVIEQVNTNSIKADITENATVNLKSSIINNFGENISNINIVVNIPNETTLTGAITTTEGVTVSYSEDSTNWVNAVTDYSKIKAVKIALPEMAEASQLDLTYGLNVDVDSIETTTALVNNLNLNFVINEQAKQDKIEYTLNVIKNETEPENPETPVEPEQPEQVAMVEIKPKTKLDTLHVGQIVTFEIKVKNTTTEKLNNVTLNYAIPEGTVLTELTYAQGSEMTFTDYSQIKNKTYVIEELNPNATVTKEVTLKILNGADKIINKADLKDTENNVIAEFESEPIIVKEGKLSTILSRRDNMEIDLTSGSVIEYIVIVKNNTTAEMNNIKISSKVPNKTIWIEDQEYNTGWKYDSDSKNLEYEVDSLAAGETKEVRFRVKVEKINNVYSEAKIENTAVVTLESGENFETNIYTSNVLAPKWDIHMTAEHNNELKEGDAVKYIIKISNTGKRTSSVFVEDLLPEEIQPRKVTYYTDADNKVEDLIRDQKVEILYPVEVGETLTIIVEGATYELEDTVSSKQISNVARISLGDEEYLESETITNTIINDYEEQPGDNEEPEVPGDNEKPDVPNKDGKYSISGLAWLDSNKDGIRQVEEKTLQLVKVILLDSKGNKVLETTTSLAGTYKFSNLDKGEYMVAFEYDTEKYAVAKYKVSNATEENNSDVISKTITLNNENKTVGITDTIKLSDKDIANIDIGLVENPKFDLSLNKYVSKVVVKNKQGTKTYEYDETELAKVEIGAKYIAGTSLLVEYEIEISNEGDVNGYVTDIIDYLPKELEFNSEMNAEWYLGKDNNLHYLALNPEPIEPGKTQTVKLVLTKTLKADSTGTIENIAEIAESTCLEALKDVDSTAGNKKSGEDDISATSLIVSIRTGSPMMYIGIVIASMMILGAGIYIIDKKVLKVRI